MRLQAVFEASYVGNSGSDIQTARNWNVVSNDNYSKSPVRDQTTINYLSANVANPFYPLLPGTNLSGTTVSRSYLLSSGVYPQFSGMSGATYDGYSSYHALQVRVERRLAQGFTFNVSYQWSKMLEATSRLNGQPSDLERVVSDQDRPQRFVTSVIWEMPFGRGRKFLTTMPVLADTFLGGWQIEARSG